MAILSMAILFNMAVTSHLIGLDEVSTCGRREEIRLKGALAIYGMLLSVVESSLPRRAGPTYQIYTRILLLATLSNMGHIHSHLCQPHQANICRAQLASLLASSPAQVRYGMDSDESVLFFLNSTLWGTPVTQAWAPAA
jgi:hypothetical protein